MKKRIGKRTLSRKAAQRSALLSGLISSLVEHGKIVTTEARAKELRPAVEKLITRARRNNLANIRLLRRKLNKPTLKKLLKDIAPRYITRAGGYTRIVRMPPRKSDGAKMAQIELI